MLAKRVGFRRPKVRKSTLKLSDYARREGPLVDLETAMKALDRQAAESSGRDRLGS
jgi:hypothetical protein